MSGQGELFRYSAPAKWANRVVSVRVTADRLRMAVEDRLIAEHPRRFD
ncbi:Mu transposase domain-containing protein [Methylosarcina fibrata]